MVQLLPADKLGKKYCNIVVLAKKEEKCYSLIFLEIYILTKESLVKWVVFKGYFYLQRVTCMKWVEGYEIHIHAFYHCSTTNKKNVTMW